MKKQIFIGAGAVISVVVLILIYQSTKGSSSEDVEVLTEAQFGDFIIDVTTTGELEAKSSVRITGPNGLQQAQIWQVKIDDIVEEGTLVKKGDYIAKLEQTQLMDKVQQAQNDLSSSDSKYTQMKLDTALELRKARDELINLEYEITAKKIVVEQSKFEPPATQMAAQIEFEKAERAYKQAFDGYKLKKQKAVAQMQEAAAERNEDQTRVNFLMRLASEFIVMAPEDGMVIYARTWSGTKKGVGSTVQAWDPVVATLPDLSKMISKTYVNEVDIRVVKPGQEVQVGLDAFPSKKLSGKVITVANVGEQKPNSDAKVFQVDILINESDTTLRPAMTTSNTIVAEVIPDVVSVPLESLHSQGDTITYVIKKEGLSFNRYQVKVGKTNADRAVIAVGLKKGDIVYLSNPAGYESKNLVMLPEDSESIASSN